MNIENISHAKALAALFNDAQPLGMGFLQYQPNHIMDEDEATHILSNSTDQNGYAHFDYLEGRVLKVTLGPSVKDLDTRLYNRDNGASSAEIAIERAILAIS